MSTLFQNRAEIIRSSAQTLMVKHKIPGTVIGVIHNGNTEIIPLGINNINHPVPVTDTTYFQIGSITKTYVGTALMQFVERRELDLHDKVRDYLPDFKLQDESVAASVEIHQLLTHTAGWKGDYFDDFGWGNDALALMVEQVGTMPLLVPMGQLFSYNNAAFYVAGRILEVLAGEPFETTIHRLIFDPLGQHESAFFARDIITESVAVGHHVRDGVLEIARPWSLGRANHSAGGIAQTMGDLLRYAQSQMDDNDALLSNDSKRLMRAPRTRVDSRYQMGLTWFIQQIDGVPIISHSGSTNGQVAILQIVPSKKFAVAVLTNSDDGNALTTQITTQTTALYLGLEAPPPQRRALPINAEEYMGHYDATMESVEIIIDGQQLVIKFTFYGGFPTPTTPPHTANITVKAIFCDHDELMICDDLYKDKRARFVRNDAGQIAYLSIFYRLHKRRM